MKTDKDLIQPTESFLERSDAILRTAEAAISLLLKEISSVSSKIDRYERYWLDNVFKNKAEALFRELKKLAKELKDKELEKNVARIEKELSEKKLSELRASSENSKSSLERFQDLLKAMNDDMEPIMNLRGQISEHISEIARREDVKAINKKYAEKYGEQFQEIYAQYKENISTNTQEPLQIEKDKSLSEMFTENMNIIDEYIPLEKLDFAALSEYFDNCNPNDDDSIFMKATINMLKTHGTDEDRVEYMSDLSGIVLENGINLLDDVLEKFNSIKEAQHNFISTYRNEMKQGAEFIQEAKNIIVQVNNSNPQKLIAAGQAISQDYSNSPNSSYLTSGASNNKNNISSKVTLDKSQGQEENENSSPRPGSK